MNFVEKYLLMLALIAFMGNSGLVQAQQSRMVRLDDTSVGKIMLTVGRSTILSFASKPSKVIVGNRGSFAIEYVANDIAIAPLHASAKSDLFVYLDNRRFAFDLETKPSGGDEIVTVRDLHHGSLKVRIR